MGDVSADPNASAPALRAGAYGVVLKCYDKEENSYVAVKKFKGKEGAGAAAGGPSPVRAAVDAGLRPDDATIREVKLLRALKHPNIINMKDAFRVRGKLHLVFPYMERNMLEVLQQHPRGIPEREVKEYVYQLCLAIHHCHRHGVMHRGAAAAAAARYPRPPTRPRPSSRQTSSPKTFS